MTRKWPEEAPDGGWPEDEATAYALSVRDGEIIAGPHVRDACARHLDDLVHGPDRGLIWEPKLASHVIGYFRAVLKLAGGEFEGEDFDPLPWQCFILGSLFGWLTEDGYRRFRTAFVLTGKGSGKSPLAAGVGLYMLTADDEPRAECYAAATKKDQAMVLFRDAVAMVEQSPSLSSRIRKYGGNPVWNLVYEETGSFFRAISSDDGQSGPRPHCGLLDEIHEHKDDEVVEMMRAGTKGRRQALIFMITNAGFDRTSVCYDRHDYGTKVAAGELQDDSFFAFICAVDEDEDPLTDDVDPELGYPRSWAKANPSLQAEPDRRTFQPKYLEEQVREARGMPAKESTVRRLNFCEWVDAESPWISGDLWRKCEEEPEDWREPAGRPCFLALDLSGKRDLTALAKVWPDGEDGFDAEVVFWTPGDTLAHRARVDRVPYDAWKRDGFVEAPSGKSIDYGFVAKEVAEIYGTGEVEALAFDPWRIEDFQRELDDLGVPSWVYEGPDEQTGDGIMLIRHGQGWGGGGSDKSLWMPRSITTLEDAILHERIRVKKNPCLTWNAASAVLQEDHQENRKWSKRKSTGRIDGIVALSMAVGAADGADVEVGEPEISFI